MFLCLCVVLVCDVPWDALGSVPIARRKLFKKNRDKEVAYAQQASEELARAVELRLSTLPKQHQELLQVLFAIFRYALSADCDEDCPSVLGGQTPFPRMRVTAPSRNI